MLEPRIYNLEIPGSALPEGLNSTNALEVTAPLGTETATPPTGDPTEVLPPGTSTSPEVGASPGDGPLDVQLPAELQPPAVPPIGEGVADPIGTVAPPIGWQAEEDAAVSTFADCGPACRGEPYDPARNVDGEADNNKDDQDANTGGDGTTPGKPSKPQEDAEKDLRDKITNSLKDVDRDTAKKFIDATLEILGSMSGQPLSGAQRVEVLKRINTGVANGDITAEGVKQIAALKDSTPAGETLALPYGPGVSASGIPKTELASFGALATFAFLEPTPLGETGLLILIALTVGTGQLMSNSDDGNSEDLPAYLGSTAGNPTTPPNPNCSEKADCGSSDVDIDDGWVEVSRWMSPEEAELWRGRTTLPQPRTSSTGAPRTYVTAREGPRGGTGTVRVDFKVPKRSLNPGGQDGWYQIFNKGVDVPIRDITFIP